MPTFARRKATQAASRTGIGRLVVLESPGGEPAEGRVLQIGPITTVGRDLNSTIYLDDEFASGTHAALTFRGRAWYVEDQGARTEPGSTATASSGRWRCRTATS